MKDTVLTVRVPLSLRRRLEILARRDGRSLSGQIERLLDQATDAPPRPRRRSLSGVLEGGRTPTLADFRDARQALSSSLDRRMSDDDVRR
jgi:hypothetical protein